MPHKVPQNIDLEDKVIGPLTLKQFIYLMVGAGIIFILNYLLPDAIRFLFFPIALIVFAFFGALAFYKPGDRPFEVLLMSGITSLTKPNKRVWKKEPYKESSKDSVTSNQEKNVEKNVSSMDLTRLAFIVDSGGFEDELKNHGVVAGIKEKGKLEEGRLTDTLEATEKPKEGLTELIKQAQEKVLKRKVEPSVQELASLKPSKEFTYEKLGTSKGVLTEYEETILKAKEQQEARFEAADVKK